MTPDVKSVKFDRAPLKHLKVGIVTFQEPETCNALSKQLVAELEHCLQDVIGLAEKGELNFLVMYGGEKSFSSGSNLKERSAMEPIEVVDFVDRLNKVYTQLEQLPLITIAAIQGPALAGGLELALTCDLRVASQTAVLGLSETSIGIIPGSGGTYRLLRVLSEAQAKACILMGKRFSADEALQAGLVTELYPDKSFLTCVLQDIERRFEHISPFAMLQTKRVIQSYRAHREQHFRQIERSFYLNTLYSKDRQEGLKAFEEKRPPQFSGESHWTLKN